MAMENSQDKILEMLIELKGDTAALKSDNVSILKRLDKVDNHLTTLNGRVIKQEAANFERQLELSKHVSDCPMQERMRDVEETLATKAGKDSDQWWWKDKLLKVGLVLFIPTVMLIWFLVRNHDKLIK